jgi:hypothetical protein
MVQFICHHSKTTLLIFPPGFHPFPSLSCLISPFFHIFSPGQLDFLAEHGYQAHCGTMRPTSRGTVQLSSGSALDAPLIDPNFQATEEDRRDLRAGLRLTVEIMEQQALQEFKRDTGTGTKLGCGFVGFRGSKFRDVHVFVGEILSTSTAEERYAPLLNLNLDSDEEVDAWIRASSHSGARVHPEWPLTAFFVWPHFIMFHPSRGCPVWGHL